MSSNRFGSCAPDLTTAHVQQDASLTSIIHTMSRARVADTSIRAAPAPNATIIWEIVVKMAARVIVGTVPQETMQDVVAREGRNWTIPSPAMNSGATSLIRTMSNRKIPEETRICGRQTRQCFAP